MAPLLRVPRAVGPTETRTWHPLPCRFPEYMSTTPVEVDLGPGETIYIPRKWPHCVLSLTDTVSLTVNFLPRCHRKEVLEKARVSPPFNTPPHHHPRERALPTVGTYFECGL